MSKGHKDLPAGSQPWANEVDKAMARIAELEAVVRRLTENAGIDMSNPSRGINTGDTPSVKSPVAQKLSSLADVDTYNVLDGQVPAWSQKDQKWLPVKQSGGIEWRRPTDDELLDWDLTVDSSSDDPYYPQVIGMVNPTTGFGTSDSYGLLGTGDAAAFLHAAGRWYGGPTRSHGTVSAQPFYVKMGCTWINDENGKWDEYGSVEVSRGDIWLDTARNYDGTALDSQGYPVDDGSIFLRTNWFYLPTVNGISNPQWNSKYPRRPVPQGGEGSRSTGGALCWDATLGKIIVWNGTKWVDTMGNDIPAPSY